MRPIARFALDTDPSVGAAGDGFLFETPIEVAHIFGTLRESGGWSDNDRYPRSLADINGDGLADLVGFGSDGVYAALAIGNGNFGDMYLAKAEFGVAAGGWSSADAYPRTLADINGDGRADIVGFGHNGVYAALANGNGTFGEMYLAKPGFGVGAGGWKDADAYPRMLADINADGLADVVGFGQAGVYAALATGNGTFGEIYLAIADFGVSAGGWSSANTYPRTLADINGDGRADIVGFGRDGVYAALAEGNGTFGQIYLAKAAFGVAAGGWVDNDTYPRMLADVNSDGLADLVGFGHVGVYAALATGGGNFGDIVLVRDAFGVDAGGWTSNKLYHRELADVNGDGSADIVGFGSLGVYVARAPLNERPSIMSGSTASVAENAPASTIVYQALGADPEQGRLTFTLSGADTSYLSIDSATGAVRLLAAADYETKSLYQFTVSVTDPGGRSDSKGVTLIVNDLPEATPVVAERESNDTLSTAQALDRNGFAIASDPALPDDDLPSAIISGRLSTPTDKDHFSVMLRAGEQLILDVDGVTPGLDTLIKVYGSNGALIGENDDQVTLDPGSSNHPTYGHNTDSFVRFRAPTDGRYTFSIESFEQGEAGSYRINVSVGPVAAAAQVRDENIDSLIEARWSGTALTYSFPLSSADYSDYPSGSEEPTKGFEGLNTLQQNAVRQALAAVGQLTNLTFTELSSVRGNAQLRYAMSDAPETAYAFLPGGSSRSGDSWYRNTGGNYDNPRLGNYAWATFFHETGHALGLKHGHETPALSPDQDSLEYSIMTYRSFIGADLGDDGGYTNETFGFPQSFMMYDIAALQRMYGADFSLNAGNTVYTWSQTTGQMFVNGVGQGIPGANRIFMTIWDGGGNDSYDLSNYTNAGYQATIDLRPGEWTTTSAIQVVNLGGGHYARGNIANALLYNSDPRSLIENAIGSSGSDTLIGNEAANRLTGGEAFDTFRWMSVEDSRPGLADVITDFASGYDRLDLSFLDAVSGTGADDSFTLIGANAFTGTAGQLRYEQVGADVHIFGDVNGDRVADLQIILSNVSIVTSNDVIL